MCLWYACTQSYCCRSVRFSLPSVLTPRYSPSSEPHQRESSNPTAHVIYLPSHHIPYSFSFNMHIHADVKKVDSTTHKLSVSQSTDEDGFSLTSVTLAEEHRFDKDLILTISPRHPHQPHAVVEQGSAKASDPPFLTGSAVTLNYFPDFSSAEAVSELIFVIDQSGSMSRAHIEAAKEILTLFLKSVPNGCHFNIVGFGSSYKFLFKTSAPYDQAHLDQASDHTRAVRADMGGTELLQPLQEIFRMPVIKGLPKQVFVLTDGAVSNTTSVINEVKKNSYKARCFAVGIGSGASTALVKGIADAGRGSSEFVQSGEKMQGKVMRMLKRALTPSLSDVHVNWSLPAGVDVIQTPSKVPPVFSGDRLVIYGFLSNVKTCIEKECHATLTGVCGGNPFENSVPFSVGSLPAQGMNKTIHRLATKCIIRNLQDLAPESYEMLKGLVKQEARKAPQSKNKLIIELSVAANVMCQDTSFVAVDEGSSEPVKDSMHLRQVPVAEAYDYIYMIDRLTVGHRMAFSSRKGSPKEKRGSRCRKKRALSAEVPPPPCPPSEAIGHVQRCRILAGAGMRQAERMPAIDDGYDEVYNCNYESYDAIEEDCLLGIKESRLKEKVVKLQKSTEGAATPQGTFSVIVSQQRASGAWQMNNTVANLLGKSVSEVKMTSPIGKQSTELQSSIWATCIVIAWLEVKCADLKDEWELLSDKAKSWIKKQFLPETLTSNDVLAAARKLF